MAVMTREPRNPTRVVPSISHLKGYPMKDVAKKCANDLVKAAVKEEALDPKTKQAVDQGIQRTAPAVRQLIHIGVTSDATASAGDLHLLPDAITKAR
jgi:hypothetical protein